MLFLFFSGGELCRYNSLSRLRSSEPFIYQNDIFSGLIFCFVHKSMRVECVYCGIGGGGGVLYSKQGEPCTWSHCRRFWMQITLCYEKKNQSYFQNTNVIWIMFFEQLVVSVELVCGLFYSYMYVAI